MVVDQLTIVLFANVEKKKKNNAFNIFFSCMLYLIHGDFRKQKLRCASTKMDLLVLFVEGNFE